MVAKAAKIEERTDGKRAAARERLQGRRQNLVDVWKIRTRCSVVPTRRLQNFVCL